MSGGVTWAWCVQILAICGGSCFRESVEGSEGSEGSEASEVSKVSKLSGISEVSCRKRAKPEARADGPMLGLQCKRYLRGMYRVRQGQVPKILVRQVTGSASGVGVGLANRDGGVWGLGKQAAGRPSNTSRK